MEKFLKRLLILVALVIMIPGIAFSLTNASPSGDVTLESGQSQTFSVQKSSRGSWVVWNLDGAEVAGDTTQYTYTAENVSTTEIHTISVVEYVRYWWWTRTADEKTWNVTVVSGTTPEPEPDPDPEPEPDPDPDPEPDPDPDPTSSCVVNYVIGSDWGGGFVANVEIINNSSDTIRGWELEWRYDGNQQVVGGWNADIEQSGQHVSASNDERSWNSRIGANGGVASFGFQGSYNGSNSVPSAFTLNGVACNDDNPGPTPDPDPDPDTYYRDADGDGYGNPDISVAGQQDGYVLNSSDCNDTDATVNPGATEVCNGMDDNCNGSIDEGVTNTYYRDADGDGYGTSSQTIQACSMPDGYADNSRDCNDSNNGIHPGASEISCDGIDQNCDGADACSSNYYRDADGDGYGNPGDVVSGPQAGYVLDGSDCNDTDATVNPGATEVCNGIDDNCNGSIDEGVQNTYYRDADGDGYGTSSNTTQACSMPYGYADNSSDCNDSNSNINPGAAEVECDGIDQNCDGADSCTSNYYRDADGDGYGDPNDVVLGQQYGYVLDSRDCDDTNPAVNPGAAEVCNGIDDNCNGLTDDEESGVVCAMIPQAPANVSASDLTSTDVNVTWTASENADYYRVYRTAWSSAGTYEQVSGNVTGTSFTYTEDWSDVANQTGGVPASYFLTSDSASGAFAGTFDRWVDSALPAMMDFKAPGYFKVEACNELGCSDMSNADAGQALFAHTSSSSEVAELVLPMVAYPVIRALSSSPRENQLQALRWCGMDLCGNIEGMTMARNTIASDYSTAQVDVYYENYTVGSSASSNANMVLNGYIGGEQSLADVVAGALSCAGDVDILLPGGETVAVYCYMEMTTSGNTGIADVTYNGNTYRFTMPVQPTSGSTGTAVPISPTTSNITQLGNMSTDYPDPITNANCVTLDPDGPVKNCTRIE